MERNKIMSNALVAFSAQGVSMCVSVVTTLLVPKILGVSEFGYWQLFIFYSTYVGFFHLGLNDGVYLQNGGMSIETIEAGKIKSQFLFGLFIEAMFGSLLILAAFATPLFNERSYILASLAPYMILKCCAFYLGYVFQAINETTKYSVSCIIERVLFFCILIALLFLNVSDFRYYVLACCLSMFFQLAYCIYEAGFIFRSHVVDFSTTLHESVKSIRIGSKLMFANIAGSMVLGITRMVIDWRWGIEAFGQLSLSLSMVNFFLAFVTQAAMVMFPALRQGDLSDLKRYFCFSRRSVSLLLSIIYLLYFPLRVCVEFWLPHYSESLIYLIYVMPICAFEGMMSIVSTTIFTVRRQESLLLAINFTTAVLSAFVSLASAQLFHSLYPTVLSASLCIVLRSVFSEALIASSFSDDLISKEMFSGILLSLLFVLINAAFDFVAAFISFLICYFVYVVFNKSSISLLAGKMICRNGKH